MMCQTVGDCFQEKEKTSGKQLYQFSKEDPGRVHTAARRHYKIGGKVTAREGGGGGGGGGGLLKPQRPGPFL